MYQYSKRQKRCVNFLLFSIHRKLLLFIICAKKYKIPKKPFAFLYISSYNKSYVRGTAVTSSDSVSGPALGRSSNDRMGYRVSWGQELSRRHRVMISIWRRESRYGYVK